jgi:GNAT superfamily N-acetyltransferase
VTIRPARPDDVARMREVEVAAGRPFADVGMDEVARDEPPTAEALLAYVDAGLAWVAEDGAVVGFLLLARHGADAHVHQVSVLPERRGERIGRDLIDAAESAARDAGATRLTLTTFAEVPWNAPYYRRLGFAVLPDDELDDTLRGIRRAEAAHGLDRWPRVAMARPIER